MKKITTVITAVLLYCTAFAQTYERTDLGAKTTVGTTDIEIQFYSPAIVRIIKSPSGQPVQKQSFSVIKQAEKTSLTIVQVYNVLQLKSETVCVSLNLLTGSVAFNGLDFRPLLAEKEYSTVIASEEAKQTFLLDKQEPIYGLGQQQDGTMDQRGESFLLEQVNTKIAIPFVQSVKGYGLFWDNYASTRFTDNIEGMSFASENGGIIDYYFMYGRTMDGTIACMRELTGQAPLFPLWTWGYWQSRERYVSQKELIGTVEHYRELQVPLDGIVQDWQYWSTDNAYWNGIEFKNPEFPDPAQLVKDIHKLNAHTIFSVWPSFGPKTEPFKVFKKNNMLLNFETFPQADSVRVYDAFNPKARDIYWDFMNKYLFSIGIDGWWLDATEAEYMNIQPAQLLQPTGAGAFNTVRNAFPLLTVGGVYDHQRKTSDSKRVFILTRSAFAGQQRYAANSWSGDIDGNWETFRKQIPGGLNFSLCAIPYWNADIGGFWVRDGGSSQHADYRELYVRWIEFGAFSPMMRSHGTSTPREIWQFGKKGDWAYDAIEKFIKLRYNLLPYHYSLSWDVTHNAGSVMRMLSMDFPRDRKVYDMGTEYLYGRSFLVVPVTQSLYAQGEKANSTVDFSTTKTYPVYLPKGADWYDFWTNEKIAGGSELQRRTPIDEIPVYVKAGSIVPFGADVQYATQKNWDNLELKIYPGKDAEFILYEDEGDNYNYEKGAYSTIQIQWKEAGHTLTIGERQGQFPGMLKERTFRIVVAGSEKTTTVRYSGKTINKVIH
ncbi:xylosidase [Bacteroidia bacterium]|nr:xylosidase [Bacteroidia bacterium]